MTRHRLEDLGRIAEKLRQLIMRDDWESIPGRRKDFPEFISGLKEGEERNGWLQDFALGLGAFEDVVYECLAIAEGQDELNGQNKKD